VPEHRDGNIRDRECANEPDYPRDHRLLLAVHEHQDSDEEHDGELHSDLRVVDVMAGHLDKADEHDSGNKLGECTVNHRRDNASLTSEGVLQLNENAAKERCETNEVKDEGDADEDCHAPIIPDLALEKDDVDPHAGEGEGGEADEGQEHARKVESHASTVPVGVERISVR